MGPKFKLFKPWLLILAFMLCFSQLSIVSATEIDTTINGIAPVESVEELITFSVIDEEISPMNADVNTYDTLEEVGAYIRQQMVNRNTDFTVALTMSYDTYIDEEWADNGNKYFINEAIKHTRNGNEGDYIAYSFDKYSVSRRATYNQSTDVVTLTHQYKFTYYNSSEQEAYVTSQIQTILKEAGVTSTMSNFEKTKLISQWMAENITSTCTDEDIRLKYSPYGAVYNGRAVCQGYSLLGYRLFLEAGVNCRMIAGTVNGYNHAWVLAQMDDGKYYNMDIMYEDTLKDAVSTKPFKYLYKGSKNFGDFANHTYIRGNTTDFNCSMFDYDTAEFDAVYPTSVEDYAVAFAGSESETTPPVTIPSDYYFDMELKVSLSGGGDVVFNPNILGGSGTIDSSVLINGVEHPRFEYLITNIMIYENGEWRYVSTPSAYSYQDDNFISFLLPPNEKYQITVAVKDYGVTPIQTVQKRYTLTIPESEKETDALQEKIAEIIANCNEYTTEYQKALYLHDWIVNHTTQDPTEKNIAVNGVLLRGKGNAEGYARAYQMLLDACGITAYRVVDNNAIGLKNDFVLICAQLDGQWTFIDIYNNDTSDDFDAFEQHVYFGLTKDMLGSLRKSYTSSPSNVSGAANAFAAATSLQNNYFVKTGQIETLAQTYKTKIETAVNNGSTSLSIAVASHNVKDIYKLYYPMVADHLSSLTYAKDVGVVYNANKSTLDITITNKDHSSHNTTRKGGKAATCEEPGMTAEVYCNTCQVVIEESVEIKPMGHNWDYYHKCKTCGKFDTTPGNLIFYGAKDDPVRAEYKIVDNNSVQYYRCKAVDGMTDVKVADYIKIGGKVYYVTSMNPNCFADKTGLTSVHVGSNITSIGAGVFKDQTELVKVTGFTKVKTIYSKAFYNCTKLEQVGNTAKVVNLPLVTEIREGTFYKCRNITVINGMNKVFSIGDQAFYGCNKLTQIGDTAKCLTLPSIKKIGNEAFGYCTSIKTIYSYSSQLTTIGNNTFQGCSNLYSVKISSDKLTSVGTGAFKGIASRATFLVHKQNVDSYKALFKNAGFVDTMTVKGY